MPIPFTPRALRSPRRALTAVALGLGLGGALLASPRPAQACGGLFCNSAQPVNQSAERILFAREGDTMHMVVKLTYQGPPIDFGWLLPVPADVTSRIGSVALFDQFDLLYAPRFVLNQVFAEGCEPFFGDGGAGGQGGAGGAGGSGGGGGEPGVQVISREVVGPYDQVVLRTESVDDLRTWLTDNAFQFPAGSDALLQGYLDMGSAVLALKLVADADENDVVPIHLTFTSDTAAIPLRPTAVAAQPDMGILVHLLGPSRAVPINYSHVQINEAAIDWVNAGANYADVVSQAADEAGGQAFVTDAAQRSDMFPLQVPDAALVARVRATRTLGEVFNEPLDRADADIVRLLGRFFAPPEGATVAEFLNCPPCYDEDFANRAFDGEGFAEALETEVALSRRLLENVFLIHPYVTRLFTTMSADEMAEDPIFAFNPDLEDVARTHQADQIISCDADGNADFVNTIIQTADGQRIPTGDAAPLFIQRQNGLTVRGEETRAAAVVERMFTSGQPELIEAYTPDMGGGGAGGSGGAGSDADGGPNANGGGGDEGCACDVADGPAPVAPLALLFGLLGLTRRRR